jgi:hypothetical protein
VLSNLVLKYQEGGSSRTKMITWKPSCLQTDDDNANGDDDRPAS